MSQKCVIVLDAALPAGQAANTAAILGISLGRLLPEIVGPDVTDRTGRVHPGIVTVPVPVLQSEDLDKLAAAVPPEVTMVDLTDLAQRCRTYPEYIQRMAGAEDLRYAGLALWGERKAIDHLTGSLPLLR